MSGTPKQSKIPMMYPMFYATSGNPALKNAIIKTTHTRKYIAQSNKNVPVQQVNWRHPITFRAYFCLSSLSITGCPTTVDVVYANAIVVKIAIISIIIINLASFGTESLSILFKISFDIIIPSTIQIRGKKNETKTPRLLTVQKYFLQNSALT